MNIYNPTKITYPCFISPKLNGVYATLCDGELRSKTGKYYPALENAKWPDTGGMIFQGELYHRDWSLQRILGAVNRDTPCADSHFVEFWIHDLQESRPTYKRIERINQFAPGHPRMKIVRHEKIYSSYMGDKYYIELTSLGYEGAVYKGYNCFLSDTQQIVKRKPTWDSEFLCIGVIEGQGKRAGHVGSFICKTHEGRVFHIGGGHVSYPMLKQLFLHPPVGKMLTCRYQYMSEEGIPICAQFISVRDYE